ncbi:hypothetical protein [Mycobacteroides abscessus]|uniref:hypothetical protein n=1 Tax=Mycobacteroides abscessus TaxID=36809 RepID=UPI0009A6B1DE|nr:hypothetical protein [Mycobacteroides abscessus]SLF56573.1 Uncharacterised protein [Mycobacteroides abscessus subsp. bolletii]
MTLSTKVAIKLPEGYTVTPNEMIEVAVTKLLTAAGDSRSIAEVVFDPPHVMTLSTTSGQGLPAWTFVHYDPEGPYLTADRTLRDKYPEHYSDGESGADELDTPACTYLLDFDTAYGYNVNGHSCNTLHARTIALLQEWVTERGGTLRWRNEYASSWHDFEDREGWLQFLDCGDQAMAWFQNIVKPAIGGGGW